MRNAIQVIVFDRSDPNQIVCITPVDHEENQTGKPIQTTRVEEIRQSIDKHGFFGGRKDIALVNLWNDDAELIEQHAVYLTTEGIDGDGVKYIGSFHKDQLRQIREKIMDAIDEGHSEMAVYIKGMDTAMFKKRCDDILENLKTT